MNKRISVIWKRAAAFYKAIQLALKTIIARGQWLFQIIIPRFRSIFSALFKLTILIAALSFIQRQEPLIENTIDHQTKIVSISNNGLSPISASLFVVRFDLNWNIDKAGHQSIDNDNPINQLNSLGHILNKAIILPFCTERIEL